MGDDSQNIRLMISLWERLKLNDYNSKKWPAKIKNNLKMIYYHISLRFLSSITQITYYIIILPEFLYTCEVKTLCRPDFKTLNFKINFSLCFTQSMHK